MRRLPVTPRPSRPGRVRYALLALGVILAGLAGYLGYVTFPRFQLPAVSGAGLLLLAAGAGLAAFFSPCSFPLLVTLLAREVDGGREERRRLRPVLVFAGAFSAGAVAFLIALGTLIGLGGRGLAASVTFTSPTGIGIRIAVGAALIVLGLMQADIVPVSFHGAERLTRPFMQWQAGLRRAHPVAGSAMFGFAYLIIGFG